MYMINIHRPVKKVNESQPLEAKCSDIIKHNLAEGMPWFYLIAKYLLKYYNFFFD